LNLIARIYRRAGARIFTLVFCLHSLNHLAPPISSWNPIHNSAPMMSPISHQPTL
jgi:hypothetical protein